MELSDANLQTLTEYLKKTLDPDPAIRRPGKWLSCETKKFGFILALQSAYNKLQLKFMQKFFCRNSLSPLKKKQQENKNLTPNEGWM